MRKLHLLQITVYRNNLQFRNKCIPRNEYWNQILFNNGEICIRCSNNWEEPHIDKVLLKEMRYKQKNSLKKYRWKATTRKDKTIALAYKKSCLITITIKSDNYLKLWNGCYS